MAEHRSFVCWFPSWPFVILLVGIPIALTACSEQPPAAVERIPAVKTLVVRSSDEAGMRSISGVIEAGRSTALSFPAGGTVAKVAVEIGDTVKAGQVLAQLDPGPFDIALRTAKAQQESAQSNLLHAKEQFRRLEKLFKRGIVAQAELDGARAALQSAESSLELAQAQFAKAQDDKRRTVIVAPFNGRISAKEISAFQEVAAGKPVITLVNAEGLKVRALVPESLARGLQIGAAVQVGVPSQPDVRIAARISEIGAVAESGAAVPVMAALETGQADLKGILVGSAATVTFPLPAGDGRRVLLVPLSALAIDDVPRLAAEGGTGGRAPLFLFNAKAGAVELRLVEVADLRGNRLAVSGGLSEGDEVVVAGTSFLKDGMRVRRWEPETPREETRFTTLGPGPTEK